jgi:CheY-like chemotaxis protein/HPt (histidine-containing phosphotransfer) domain-containing protein
LGAEQAHFVRTLIKPIRQSQLFDAVMKAIVQPTRAPAPAKAVAAVQEPAPKRAKSAKILLAEDMDVNQFVATEILSRAGYGCDIVSTGREAVCAVASKKYDLVLMDLQMPEMSGLEASEAIRAAEAASGNGTRLPIIALTANAIKGDRERCLAAGMDSYLTKPLNPKLLIATLEAFVKDTPASPASPAADKQAEPGSTQTRSTDEAKDIAPASPAIDYESLLARCMGDVELVAKIAQKFRDRSLLTWEHIEKGFADGDATETARLAHTMKGTAANLSAVKLSELAAQIEQLGKAGDLSTAEETMRQMGEELSRCRAELEQLTASQGIAQVA